MTFPLTMRQVAAEVGVHYDTMRRHWPDWVSGLGFPRPFLGLRWDAAQIQAWKADRSHAAIAAGRRAPLKAPQSSRVERDRAALQALRAG